MRILAIETSCDETAAAVLQDGTKVLSSVVASQLEDHGAYGGVVPEIASRMHTETVSHIVEKALFDAGETLKTIDAVAVTAGPGLVGALLVGVNFAKGLAFAAQKPLIPVHHIRGHIASCYLADNRPEPPFLCLVISGGHSHIVRVDGYTQFNVLGRTRDDAAGEAFDKVARAMGLGYPGGPAVDAAARKAGGDVVYTLPFPKVEGHPLDFSFSGLKTAVVNIIHNARQKGEEIDTFALAASFERVVCESLTKRLIEAAHITNIKTIAIAGGVSANSRLREMLLRQAAKSRLSLCIPPLWLTGDNAAMIAAQAFYEFRAGNIAGTRLNALASVEIDYESPAVFEADIGQRL
jgi:N6-L-threonylcarbamoyladenine synthase